MAMSQPTRQDGDAIRRLRRQRGIRTGEFAPRISAAVSTVVGVENGSYQASIELLYRMSRELGVDITEILSDRGRDELKATA